jgi:hypothetical protein
MYWLRLFRSRPGFLAGQMFFAAKKTARRLPVIYKFLKRLKNQASSWKIISHGANSAP